ncbi:MAG: hypothetical protein ACK49N_11030, partial [Verrucomicrobiota bacterium]
LSGEGVGKADRGDDGVRKSFLLLANQLPKKTLSNRKKYLANKTSVCIHIEYVVNYPHIIP